MPITYKKTAQSYYYESIKADLLDKFLAKGWYRMGPSIFTSHYINYESDILSAIWLRTVLPDYTLSKSLRKIDKKNKAAFTHRIDPYAPSPELDQLYLAYRNIFKGTLPESLSMYMMDSLDLNIYDSRLVKIYDHDKLIACSIFDVGTDTIASIFGFYDPTYKAMSLGLYTMLLEIEFCQAQNMSFYYMGYFLPGNPRFDYKLRIGYQEYLDFKSGEWLPMTRFDVDETPINIARRKLEELQTVLNPHMETSLKKNAYIDAHIIEFIPLRYIEDPLLLLFEDFSGKLESDHKVICSYNIRTDKYHLILCQMLNNSISNYDPEWLQKQDDDTYKQQLVMLKTLKACKTMTPIIQWLSKQSTIN